MSDEVYFLHAEKHESFLKIVTVIFDVVKNSQSSQNSNFAMSLQYHNKEVEIKLIFCMQVNIEFSYKLISTLWASKFPVR